MIRLLFILFISSLSFSAYAIKEVINVGILWGNRPASSVVSIHTGSYTLYGDNQAVKQLTINQTMVLRIAGGQVQVTSGGKVVGSYKSVRLKRNTWGSAFNLKAMSLATAKRTYNDNLKVSVYLNKLKLINNVYIEHYIGGVVEAESGSRETYEYYKVQAIIARTYVLSNLSKYAKFGFNVCDRVNSQVYKGMSTRNPDIIKATNATRGLVLVDSDINLIQAVFHSNSGGQTANSEDAWSKEVDYLRSIPDTFSLDQPHYNWKTFLEKEKWLSYLEKKYSYPVKDSVFLEYVLDYCPTERDRCLSPLAPNTLLKTIRIDWGFRSTFFSISEGEEGKYVYFEGRGFGHGVGLSQEGAMRMAELGIPYNKILKYYYKDTHLIHLSALDFFRGE
jgi:stage II sporulation protein D